MARTDGRDPEQYRPDNHFGAGLPEPDDQWDWEEVPLEYVDIVGGDKLKAHPRSLCAGTPCCVHNPSPHHMTTWRQLWRSDRGIMERICSHGIGHPDPDDLALHTSRAAGIHGCDGCCVPPNKEIDQ